MWVSRFRVKVSLFGATSRPTRRPASAPGTAGHIVKAIQTGERPDGRILAPIMPWHAFAELAEDDAKAIAAFLQNLAPVSKGRSYLGTRSRPSPGETAATAQK